LFKVPFTGDAVLYIYDKRLQQAQSILFGGTAITDTILQNYPTAILVSHPMTIVISVLQYTLLIIFGFFTIYLMMLSILALFAKKSTSFPSLYKRKFCIIIPAHNEELSIERTLQSVFKIDYPRDYYDVVVIADNCTDNTATIAAEIGSIVFERSNIELRGKGFALRWCFDKLLSSDKGYEAFVVIDADSIASKNILAVLNFYLDRGSKVIQATDIVEPQPGVWSSEMTRIGFLLYNYIRALGRTVIHCPTGLHGNGMCFSVDVIKEVPWKAYSLAEDLEYGLQLLLQGYQTDFAPEAVVLATMPQQSTHAESQHARWEGGRFPVIRRYSIPLLRASVLRWSYKYFDRLIDLITPALVNLLVMNLGMFLLSFILYLIGINMMGMFAMLWGVVSIVGFLHLFLGLVASGADRSTYKALLYLPKYVFWKMSFLGKLLRTASSDEWIRTTREKPNIKETKRFTN
jgi:cellulose synthase/poly-beta-1,6-N-acetylglucosamine synthase-like glycosyltransferase